MICDVKLRIYASDAIPAEVLLCINQAIEGKGIELISSSATPLRKRGPKPSLTAEQMSSIKVLRDQGWTVASIAKSLDISRGLVHRSLG